jgi:hypothetical protein
MSLIQIYVRGCVEVGAVSQTLAGCWQFFEFELCSWINQVVDAWLFKQWRLDGNR